VKAFFSSFFNHKPQKKQEIKNPQPFPGMVVVYIADNYSKGQTIGIGIAFMILPIIAVALRLWAKFLGRRKDQSG